MSSQRVYSVATFHDGHYMMTSNCFETKPDAQEFMEYCSHMEPSKLTFQMYTHKSSGDPSSLTYHTDSTDSATSTIDLTHMTVERHGAGLLLRPFENCEFHGEKYFLNGWWMARHEAWFFKDEFFDDLINYGAEYISDYPLGHVKFEYDDDEEEEFVPEEHAESEEELEYNSEAEGVDYGELISGMTLERYGKGFMLYPDSKSHSHYGQKYMGNGWWNTRVNGWFFREMYLDELLDAGAMLVTDSEVDEDTDPCSPTASSFTRSTRSSKQNVSFESAPSAKAATELGSWQTYGKGWLLKPTKKHSKYGEKIYRGGWWMPKHSAWFFKQSVAVKL
jgi:hypothetical protein